EASGSHEVPDPIRVSGMPRGPAFISMGCGMSICARSGDAAPAMSNSKSLRISILLKPKSKARAARATQPHYGWDGRPRLEAVERAVGRSRKRTWCLVLELPYAMRHAGR